MKLTPFTESSLFSDLDKVEAWLYERGFTQHNRLRIYRENLIEMRDADAEKAERIRNTGRMTEILASYVEGFELSEALRSLIDGGVEIPDELLKRALDGHADAAQETAKSSHGRNAMFELSIAAAVARQGVKPMLNLDKPDLEFEFDGHRVSMECKRVMSENGLEEAISGGVRQLRKKVEVDANGVGVVAVNISRVFNRGDGWWVVPNEANPVEILAVMIRDVIIKPREAVILRYREAAVRGILFYAAGPFEVDGRARTIARTAVLVPLNPNDALLRGLAQVLKV